MAAHRYWRVRFNAQSGVATPSAAEIQFRDTPGGPHLAGTTTVSSSWNAGSNPVSNCFDGNPATWWACNSGADSWLQIDYGLGNDKEIVELFWQARADAGTQSPGKIAVDWSDDGVDWTPFADVGGFTWTNGQSRAIDLTAVGEVRVYQLSTEVTHTDEPLAPIQIYQLSTEVTHIDPADAPIRIYATSVEVIRHIADRYNWELVEDDDYVAGDFTFTGATGWGFIDDSSTAFFGFSVQIPYYPAIEKNPYAGNLPADSASMEEYFHEQQRILREQHDRTQAGDTTFDYGLLFQLYANEEFTLGSLGRFKHDKWGLIHARFCKLKGFVAGASHGKPVGWFKGQTQVDWVVTNDFAKSGPLQSAGIVFFYDSPADDMYGWVVVNGANPGIVTLKEGSIAQQGEVLGWAESNKVDLEPDFGLARPVVNLGGSFARAGELFIRLEPITEKLIQSITDGELAEINESIDELNVKVSTHEVRLGTIDSQIVTLTQTDESLLARLKREETARQRDIRSIRDSLANAQDWQPEINEMGNTLRAEFNQAIDSVAQDASNALTIATNVQTQVAGFDFAGLQSQVDSTVGSIITLSNRLTNFNVDWPTPADGQVLVSGHTDNPDGNPSWWFAGVDFVAASLPFAPAGGITSEDVQAAIEELDSNKANASDLDDLITGPASATNNALVRFDGTTGKLVQDSGVTVDSFGNMLISGTFNSKGVVGVFDNSAGTYTSWQKAGVTIGDTGTGNHIVGGSSDDFGLNTRIGDLILASVNTSRVRITAAGYVVVDSGLTDAVDDTAAATAGVPVKGLYRNGSQVMIRVT